MKWFALFYCQVCFNTTTSEIDSFTQGFIVDINDDLGLQLMALLEPSTGTSVIIIPRETSHIGKKNQDFGRTVAECVIAERDFRTAATLQRFSILNNGIHDSSSSQED